MNFGTSGPPEGAPQRPPRGGSGRGAPAAGGGSGGAGGPADAQIEKKAGGSATDGPVRALTGPEDESGWSEDLDLVRATLHGDEGAIERFVERMVCIPRFIRRFDLRMGSSFDVHERDDLCQEVAARVWRDRARFSGGSRIESWVFGYARHVFMEALGGVRARAGREGTLEAIAQELPDGARPIDGVVAAELDAQIILDRVDELPERERDLVRVKLFEGASFSEIARRLGEDVNAVKTRYYRAIQRVRDKLARGGAPLDSDSREEGL